MKIVEAPETKQFTPYGLAIETIEEHNFLLGLFGLTRHDRKMDSESFDSELDSGFFHALLNHRPSREVKS